MTQAELERLRRHREEMVIAIAEGLSLDAARERLASYRANLRRLAAVSTAPTPPVSPPRPAPAEAGAQPGEEPSGFWWNRD